MTDQSETEPSCTPSIDSSHTPPQGKAPAPRKKAPGKKAVGILLQVHSGLGTGAAKYELTVRSGTTLSTVLRGVGVDLGLVGVASSEGRVMLLETPLEEDGEVDVYPLIGGG